MKLQVKCIGLEAIEVILSDVPGSSSLNKFVDMVLESKVALLDSHLIG